MTVFGHPGMSQLYFLTAARPYLSIAAAAGLLAALAKVPRRRRTWPICSCAVAGGVVAVLVATVGPTSPLALVGPGGPGPEGSGSSGPGFGAALAVPVIVLCAVVAAAFLLFRRTRWRRAAIQLLLAGFSAPTVAQSAAAALTPAVPAQAREIPEGGVESARWLRDHSGADDIVATNAHCRFTASRSCDNRQFWVAAYTERRILVEGWGYTARNLASLTDVNRDSTASFPFWDRELLAANDAVFDAPTAEAVRSLAHRYGVRWLMVDRRRASTAPDLGEFAGLRYEKGPMAVYEIAP
ncbi:hypothetical protein [Streptosporangium sp. NPDC087985]|uniref:hypothetical protein n=1 Tax=Streptosporangium sp. NPDC087985 TaxID=3366196 RepID=UPI00380D5BB1